jgi:outer membrane protein assembly factor BamD
MFAQKAMDQFKKLVKEYPESRYATDALAKIEVCRGRLAQKEVWVAAYYMSQGNPAGARPRLEKVIKDYPRSPVIPEAMSLLADVNFSEGREREAVDLLRHLANDYSYTEWGKRAEQRLRAQR